MLNAILHVLTDAYDEETLENGETRVVMRFNPVLAPVKAAILPLRKKYAEKAEEIRHELSYDFAVTYDEAGSIGKRYRRQDEVGTPSVSQLTNRRWKMVQLQSVTVTPWNRNV